MTVAASPAQTVRVRISEFGYTVLQVETAAACNMACTFCAYPTKTDKQARLAGELIEKALDSVDPTDERFTYVCLSQFNEPFLDPRIHQTIGSARQRGLRTKVITNGLLLQNATIVQRTLETPPDLLKISLQTPERRQYEAVRGVKLDFDRYVEGIQRFLSAARGREFQVVVDVGCNFLTPVGAWGRRVLGLRRGDPAVPNAVRDILPHIRLFLEGLKRVDPAFPVELDDAQQLAGATSRYWEEEGLALAKNIRFKIKPFGYGRRLQEFAPTEEPIACKNEVLGILADGSVVPCCMAYNSGLAMGNLKEESLGEILRRNRDFLGGIKGATNRKPEVCKRCLGQPTKRGVVVSWRAGWLKTWLGRL